MLYTNTKKVNTKIGTDINKRFTIDRCSTCK